MQLIAQHFVYSRFDNYRFTGSLLPWPRTARSIVPSSIIKPDYHLTGIPEEEQKLREIHRIVVRTPEEIEVSLQKKEKFYNDISAS